MNYEEIMLYCMEKLSTRLKKQPNKKRVWVLGKEVYQTLLNYYTENFNCQKNVKFLLLGLDVMVDFNYVTAIKLMEEV